MLISCSLLVAHSLAIQKSMMIITLFGGASEKECENKRHLLNTGNVQKGHNAVLQGQVGHLPSPILKAMADMSLKSHGEHVTL